MKRMAEFSGLLMLMGMTVASPAGDNAEPVEHMGHHDMMRALGDERVSLGLSPQMQLHQLANMRSHVEAVQSIVGLIAEKNFQEASQIAHTKLGLTDEMKMMCNMFENEEFRKLGLAFHESGDALGEVLQSGDGTKSLVALHTTLGYCVQCHATFRQ
jgi:hypothetical protein